MTNTKLLPSVLGIFGLVLAVLLAGGAVVAGIHYPGASGAAFLDVPDGVPRACDNSLGFNTDLMLLEASSRDRVLETLEEAGFRWLRQRFDWGAMEPEPGTFRWAASDEIVRAAGRHNLGLIAVLDGSPRWARDNVDADNALAPPTDAGDFGRFASAFATRYGDQIDYYEIWDEPNIAPHWGNREVDPEAYARLLREGAIQIRSADSGAVILIAALAPNLEPGGANMSELEYLDALYRWGAAPWFDIVAAQLYGFEEPLHSLPGADRLNWARGSLLRDTMLAHGDVDTAVWAVSFGWDARTAEAVRSAVEKTRVDWPWLGPMLWAAWSPRDAHGQFAVTDLQGHATGSFEPLRELALAQDLAWPGVYGADHPIAEYQGDWRVTPLGADIGGSGDKLTIRFRGTRLDLAVRCGDYRAFLFADVDGQPANGLPTDSDGRAYVVLYDPLGEMDTVTLARGLADNEHVAEIVADRGWGQWAIAGWTVSREARDLSLLLPAVLGWASVAVLGATIAISWRNRRACLELLVRLLSCCRAVDIRYWLVLTAGAGVLVYITEGTVVSLVSLGVLALLLLLRPEAGLPLICLSLPFYQLGKPLLGKVFSMVEILVLLTALAWVANRLADRALSAGRAMRGAQKLTAIDGAVVGLLVLGAVSLLWAEHGREAAREFRTVILEAALFYGLLRATVRDRRSIWRVSDAWVVGGAAIALVGIAQWVSGWNVIAADGVWRVRGFYGSPNNLALYLGRVFPLCIAVAAWGRRERRRYLYGVAAVAMGVSLFLTYSRGAWLVGVPASVVFLGLGRVRRAQRLRPLVGGVVVVAVLVAVILVLVLGTGRVASLLDASEGPTSFRLMLWRSSLAMIQDHPLLGVGLDNFLYQYRTRYVLPTAWEEFDLSHPHNLVFDFWLRLGLLGLLVLGWLLVGFFRSVWESLGRPWKRTDEPLVLGLAAGVVSFAAHGLVDNAYFLVDLAFSLMLAMALVQAIADDDIGEGI